MAYGEYRRKAAATHTHQQLEGELVEAFIGERLYLRVYVESLRLFLHDQVSTYCPCVIGQTAQYIPNRKAYRNLRSSDNSLKFRKCAWAHNLHYSFQ